MKKAFDQTVRDLKRGVNKNVLKVPKVEQKILDATSNEPWGPHGSLLADIAQASRNYHEYQMIMSVIWKRINDTGKNWRHVYKALTVLDYLVAHGSERVIDDIREHSYQIGTLSDFQYIDSSGRDQGQNVRRKSQSLVSLVNNKERIQEVREKAAANREKYRTSFSTGGGNRPGSGGYGDRYDDDRYSDNNGYGREREREWNGGSRDEDRNGRNGSDGYSRDGDRDRYGRESDENYEGRYSNYREDDYRTSRGGSDGGYGPTRNRNSFDRERDRAYDDDDRHSSRSAGGNRADESSHDDRRLENKLSEPAAAVPPYYEEATRDSPIPSHEESKPAAAVLEAGSLSETLPRSDSTVEPTPVQQPPAAVPAPDTTQTSRAADGFDEFDPRHAFTASPPAPAATIPPANNLEMDFFGSEEIGPLALVSMTTTSTTEEHPISTNSGFEDNSFMGMPHDFSSGFGQGGDNPFGDAVFKATPDNTTSTALVPQQANMAPPTAAKLEETPTFNFGDALGDLSFSQPPSNGGVQDNSFAGSTPFMANQFAPAPAPAPDGVVQQQTNQFTSTQAPNPYFVAPTQPSYPVPQPQSSPTTFNQTSFPQSQPPATFNQTSFQQTQPPATFNQTSFQQSQPPITFNQTSFQQSQPPATFNQTPFTQSQPQSVPATFNQSSFQQRTQTASNTFNQTSSAGNFVNQSPLFSLETTAPPAVKPQTQTQPAKKFETKSSVWTDTLNRGLVNLNISGPTINPHADLGIDFDSMNRKERREEKKSIAPAVVSTTMMGKAMGGGSRSNATSMAPPRNPMPGTGMGGMGGMGGIGGMAGAGMGGMAGPGMGGMAGAGMGGMAGVGMGGMAGAGTNVGYGMGGMGMGGMNMGMSQQVGMGGMGTGMGMGYNGMSMGQQMNMRPMGGMPQAGPGAPGVGYNPGTGYGAQQPYGGGYR